MSDDPSAAGDPEAGRSDLYARIQDLQDEVDSGLTATQVGDAVRGAIAALLPELVSEAVSSAVAGTLPLVAISVADAVTERLPSPDSDGVEARLAALEDALDGVGDRLEALTRDQAATTAASLEDLRAEIAEVRGESRAAHPPDGRRDDIDALREDLADALDYVRTTLASELTARSAETQSAIRALSGSLSLPDAQPLADQLDEMDSRLDRIIDGIARADGGLDLAPLHERLDTIQESLPNPDEPSDIARLQERLDAIAESLPDLDTSSAVARLHERLDTLSQQLASPDLTPLLDRLDALPSQLPVPDLSPLHEQIAAVAAAEPAVDIEPLLARLDAIEQAVAAADLGPVHQRLDDLVARLSDPRLDDDDMEALHVRFDSLLTAVDTAAQGVRDRQAAETERLRAGLADQAAADAAAHSSAVVSAVERAVETATAAAREDAAVVRADAVDAAAAANAATETLTAQVASLAESLATSAEAADALRADLAADTGVAERIGPDMAGLQAHLAAIRADLDAPAARVANELDGLRAVVVEAFELLQQSVDARISRLASSVSDQILDVRTDMATTAGETLSTLASIRDRPQADEAGRLDAIAEGLRGRLAGLDDRLAALRVDLLDVVDRGQTSLGDQLAAAHDDIRSGMLADGEAQRAAVDGVREAQDMTIARLEQISEHPLLSGVLDVGDELGDLRARMADVLRTQEQVAAAAREDVRQEAEAAAERANDLRERLEELQDTLRTAVDGFPQQVAAWRAETVEDRARLAEALSGLEYAREEMAHLVEHIGNQGTTAAATVHDAALTALDQMRGDSAAAADDVRREADAARAALEEQAAASRQGALDDLRVAAARALDDVRAAVAEQAQETRAATTEMEQIAHRVQSAGRLVVAYLAERDAALEEVRDRDTLQLLEDVLSALTHKEREKAAGQTRGILARRRESRQAERWRQHHQGHDDPDVVVDEQALLELLDAPAPGPLPDAAAGSAPTAPDPVAAESAPAEQSEAADASGTPPAPRHPQTAPTKAPPAKAPPAKKAPAKKAPAKKAPAKKAPAKKAPAKKAPAKKAPAKKAPAKKAPAKKARATRARPKKAPAKKAPAPTTRRPPAPEAPETPSG